MTPWSTVTACVSQGAETFIDALRFALPTAAALRIHERSIVGGCWGRATAIEASARLSAALANMALDLLSADRGRGSRGQRRECVHRPRDAVKVR